MSLRVLAFIFLLSMPTMAEWYAPFCKSDQTNNTIASCKFSENNQIEGLLPESIQEWHQGPVEGLHQIVEVAEGARELSDSITKHLEEWGDFTRWLRGMKTKNGTSKEFQKKWDKLETEGRALLEVFSELAKYEKKLQTCYEFKCHPSTILELSDNVNFLKKLKVRMTAASPWWISENFLELAAQENSQDLPTEKLKEVFGSSMGSFFKESMKIQSNARMLEREIKEGLIDSKDPKAVLTGLFLPYPHVMDAIIRRKLISSTGHDREMMCEAARLKQQFDKVKSATFKTFQVGLLTAGMLVGPESFLVSKVASSAAPRGWLAKLTSRLTSKPKSIAIGSDVALSGIFITEWAQMSEECKRELALTKVKASTQSEWKQCLQKKNTAKIGAMLSSVGTLGSLALPKVLTFVGKTNIVQKSPFFTRDIDSGRLVFLDLSRKSEIASKEIQGLPDKYWNYVSETYKSRLNLSKQEVDDFIASSRAFEPRTNLIVSTKKGTQTTELNGGVAIVESKNASDLLPFEKATGVRMPRDGKTVAEIVRLTADKEAGGMLYKELITEVAKFFKSRPDIDAAYIYTSKTHVRLYKRLGVPAKDIKNHDGRDVIVTIEPNDLIEKLLKDD